MTSTRERPTLPTSQRREAPVPPTSTTAASGVRRTLVALLACVLGTLPLTRLVSGVSWLIDLWLAMGVVLLPALLLRIRRAPGALQIWPGVVLLVLWLTARFVPTHAVLGIIPGPGAWHDVNTLLTDLHDTMHNESAPVPAAVSVRLALALLMALLTALVDLLAVVGRHAALAGLPLLAVLTVCGAVTRAPVPWPMFVLAAAGYLLLLALDSPDDIAGWGYRIDATTTQRRGSILMLSGPWLAAVAVVVALVVAVVVPSRAHNALTDALHNGVSAQGNGRTGTSIDPWAGLRGNLDRGSPINLAQVTIGDTGSGVTAQPFYLRTAVLSTFIESGWVPAPDDGIEALQSDSFPVLPADQARQQNQLGVQDLNFAAAVQVDRLSGNPMVFADPTIVRGLSGSAWSPSNQTLTGSVHSGLQYTMQISQPVPTADQLAQVGWPANVPNGPDAIELEQYEQLPAIPAYVHSLLNKILGTSAPADGVAVSSLTPYETAKKINDFFSPANGFQYTLSTAGGDSGSALVDFLQHKQGFCQQYAAAEAVLFRMAGLPARVVLGYMHDVPDKNGQFTITSQDAHAWVEAYFAGVGWVPFDPTPIQGIAGGPANDLQYASHSGGIQPPSANASSNATDPTVHATRVPNGGSQSSDVAGNETHGGGAAIGPWVIAAVAVLLFGSLLGTPRMVRANRRRRRLAAAHSLGPEPLWEELADTACDLGYVWSASRSPQQVASWLAGPAGAASNSLTELARAVEVARYAPPAQRRAAGGDQIRDLRAVQSALRTKLSPKQKFWSRWAPKSVLSGRRS